MLQISEPNPIKPVDYSAGIKQQVLIVASQAAPATRMIYEIPFRILSGPFLGWRIIPEYYLKPSDIEGINVLVLYRCFKGSTLSIIRLARVRRIKVVYELDDDLIDPPVDENWGVRFRNSHFPEIIKMFLAEADLIKAGSPELARRLNERGYPAIYQPYTAKICELTVKTIESPYRIGYFGSPHHRNDIEIIFPALLKIKESFQDQVVFEFIGCYPSGWRQLTACIMPFKSDYETFMEFLAGRRWSLGLAPLRRTSFNEAKSNSKFRDFTAAGTLGIYSDSAPYRDSILNTQNGWLVKDSSEEWYETIKKALCNSERAAMLQQARKLLQTVYSPESVARNWVILLKNLSK